MSNAEGLGIALETEATDEVVKAATDKLNASNVPTVKIGDAVEGLGKQQTETLNQTDNSKLVGQNNPGERKPGMVSGSGSSTNLLNPYSKPSR